VDLKVVDEEALRYLNDPRWPGKFFARGQGIVTELWLECELSTKSDVTAVTT
jgi:hypothetical protein